MTYRIPRLLAWYIGEGDSGLDVFLMPLPNGDPVVLRGIAALIWVAATEEPDPVATIAEATRQAREEIETHVLAYLDELVLGGLLELAAS